MNPNDLTADLPAPRNDEPESLRQDIVDELADHLQCSLQRELLASRGRQSPEGSEPARTEQAAWPTVLDRFGNPASIARKLWFDAMQEKLMAQRITAVMAGITAVAAVAVAVLLWRGVDRQAQAAAEAQKSNAALLTRLVTALESRPTSASAGTAEPADDRTLRTLELRLVHDEPGGPPAAGCRLSVAGVSQDKSLVRLVDPLSDKDGKATLSMNRVGVFYVSIETPEGAVANTLIPMGPDYPNTMELVVPSEPDRVQEITIMIPKPAELADENFLYELTISPQNRDVEGVEWYFSPNGVNAMAGRQHELLVADDGHILGAIAEVERRGPTFDGPEGTTRTMAIFKTVPFEGLARGRYHIESIAAYRPSADSASDQRDRLGTATNVAYQFATGTTFQSIAGEQAIWTIPLPDFTWKGEVDGDTDLNLGGGGGGFF